MWSPTHPALFACVDGVGHLDLWNLNNDTEVRWSTKSTGVFFNPFKGEESFSVSSEESRIQILITDDALKRKQSTFPLL